MIALDLFAGTGWGVACRRLGIEEYGVEFMPEAVATREANGMRTLYRDVWEGLEGAHPVPEHGLLIASPPCQTFSMAGGGKGRQALDEVVGLIDAKAYLDVRDLRAFGERHDMRTALVLTPLAHIARDVPMYVVLEQVPPVLPVWERYAEELRKWGYSVVTGILNAEQYGVPQTRRRAILIARADGIEARMPTPTHSRYYSRDPQRLDPGVLPWVSMAEALGWGNGGLVDFPRRDDGLESVELDGVSYRARDLRPTAEPAQTVTEKARSWQGWGFTDRPAVAVGNAVGRGLIGGSGAKATVVGAIEAGTFIPSPHGDGSSYAEATRITVEEAAALQSYPVAFSGAGGGAHERIGLAPRELDQPAHTIVGKGTAGWVASERPAVWESRPATSVAADDRIAGPGRSDFVKGGVSRQDRPGTVRVTEDEAAALQSYPHGFTWCGTKTKRFLQIGNAVPPLLAEAILATLVEPRDTPKESALASVNG